MKICNNCGTENPTEAQQCGHCKMAGNFRHSVPSAQKPEPAATIILCRNCGSSDPGPGAKCQHCHFPLPAPTLAHSFTKLSLQSKLRAG